MIEKEVKFPSPYGVTVIKSRKSGERRNIMTEFPSPYGVTVIKSIGGTSGKTENGKRFPSPYGVTVIKSRHVREGR